MMQMIKKRQAFMTDALSDDGRPSSSRVIMWRSAVLIFILIFASFVGLWVDRLEVDEIKGFFLAVSPLLGGIGVLPYAAGVMGKKEE